MPIYSELTSDDIKKILETYDLGALQTIDPITTSSSNSNYKIGLETGDYILTVIEELTEAGLSEITDFLRHLAQAKIPCPEPLETRDKSFWTRFKEHIVVIVPVIPGESALSPTIPQCQAFGAQLGTLHGVCRRYTGPLPDSFSKNWEAQALNALEDKLDEDDDVLLQLANQSRQYTEAAECPVFATHTDLFRDNVFFLGEQCSGIIDFYYASYRTLAYDLAVVVNDWCIAASGELNEAAYDALVGAYHRIHPLSAREQSLWQHYLILAAFRFWLSRKYAFHFPKKGYNPTAYNPAVFANILRRHVAQVLPYPQILPESKAI